MRRSILLVGIAALIGIQTSSAQPPPVRGIAVGAPKVFDNRTLNLMLERLNEQLSTLTPVDQKPLTNAIGTIQGSSVQDVSRGFSIQASLSPSASKTSGTSSASSTAPTTPDLLPSPSSLTNLQYSLSASDLLSEQVELSYQIVNLRLLLDRALSDRLLNSSEPRLQTVVGLNISIDPPRDAESAVAMVEVTIRPEAGCTSAHVLPSLVALMPQEHTYNSAALNSKSNAFGGSAVFNMVSVGYSERRRGQTYYLFHDNDTISFERQPSTYDCSMTFGWAFRPVLGRKSVSPGTRQMFAVISLPYKDGTILAKDLATTPPIHMLADVTAYWKKYDPRSLTSATDAEVRPWSKVAYGLSLGTRLTFAPKGRTTSPSFRLDVPLTSSYLNALCPTFTDVRWRPVGSKQAVIAIRGQNLFQDTKIVLGDKVFSGSGSGLRAVSDQSMDIIADMSALVADASVLGRYGPAEPLEQNHSTKKNLSIWGVTIDPPVGGFTNVNIIPRFEKEPCLNRADLDDHELGQPLVFLNGTPVPLPYEFPVIDNCAQVVARVPEAMMASPSGVFTLKFPFRGAGLTASRRIYDASKNFALQTVTAGKDYLVRKVDGPYVPEDRTDLSALNWSVLVGGERVPLEVACPEQPRPANVFCLLTPHDNLARLTLGKPCPTDPATTKLKGRGGPSEATKTCSPKMVIVQEAFREGRNLTWEGSYPLSLPKDASDAEKPSVDAKQIQTVNQHDSVWRNFTGKALASVAEVIGAGRSLQTHPNDDGTSIAVLIPPALTRDPASIDLTFLDKTSSQIGTAQLLVKPVSAIGGTK